MKKRRRLKRKVKLVLAILLITIIICLSSPFLFKIISSKKDINQDLKIPKTTIKKEEIKKAKLTLVGDFLFESPFYKAIQKGYDKERYFSLVNDYFRNDDLSIGNMEVVIGNDTLEPSGDGYSFCAPEYIGDLVNTLDLQVLSTANNHLFDRGIVGLNSTLDYFHNKTNIMTVGTYKSIEDRNKKYIKEINGIKFGFLAYTYGTNAHINDEYLNLIGEYKNPRTKTIDENYKNILTKEITTLRNEVDVLIVMMHWGNEFTFKQNNEQITIAEFLNSLGVDIVYGSHSHSIQPIEVIGEDHKTLVYYSLGNFVSHDNDIARTPLGQETFDNAYQLGLLSTIELEIVDNNLVFNNIDTDLIVNYFNKDMSDFLLIPYDKYTNEYETSHLRYNLGLTKFFINNTYTSVINPEYRK